MQNNYTELQTPEEFHGAGTETFLNVSVISEERSNIFFGLDNSIVKADTPVKIDYEKIKHIAG